MNYVYDAISGTGFESMRLAAQVFGCNEITIKQLLDKGPRLINGRKRDLKSTPVGNDPFNYFIKQNNLKRMVANFYLAPDLTVHMWASKKRQWYDWKVTTFENGDKAFKTELFIDGLKVKKWIQVTEYGKKLFPEIYLTPADKVEQMPTTTNESPFYD